MSRAANTPCPCPSEMPSTLDRIPICVAKLKKAFVGSEPYTHTHTHTHEPLEGERAPNSEPRTVDRTKMRGEATLESA